MATAAQQSISDENNIGSGLFWPSPRHPLIFKAAKAIEAHGSGLFLTPYSHKGKGMTIMDDADGSSSGEDHDDKAVHDKIWGIIAHNNYIDELSSLKFFVRLRQSIDHDETFQRVIKRIRILLLRDDAEHLTFNEALDKIIEN